MAHTREFAKKRAGDPANRPNMEAKTMTVSSQPRILVVPQPGLYHTLFTPDADRALRKLGHVVFNEQAHNPSSPELAGLIPDFDIVLTGWGTPTFTPQVLDAANRLKLVAHTAGSIKKMLPRPVFERGIAVTHAAGAIAPAVADMSLMLIMLMLRHAYRHDQAVRAGEWRSQSIPALGQEIVHQRIGVVGAGYTGRCLIKLLRALGVETWVYDPYLSNKRAAELGVHQVELDDLLANCRVVSMQVPSTPATYHMIGARELGLMQDGAALVNTARAHSIDQEALLAELESGRIQAALDVFDQEPLPPDHPYRALPNVFLTPHIAGASEKARQRQGDYTVQEIERFVNGQPLQWPVTIDMLDTMA